MPHNSTSLNHFQKIAIALSEPYLRPVERKYNLAIIPLQQSLDAISPEAAAIMRAIDNLTADEKIEVVCAAFAAGFQFGLKAAAAAHLPERNAA